MPRVIMVTGEEQTARPAAELLHRHVLATEEELPHQHVRLTEELPSRHVLETEEELPRQHVRLMEVLLLPPGHPTEVLLLQRGNLHQTFLLPSLIQWDKVARETAAVTVEAVDLVEVEVEAGAEAVVEGEDNYKTALS